MHRTVFRHDGTTQDGWYKYRCGHCGIEVAGAKIAHYEETFWLACPNCLEGSVRDREGTLHPGALFGPEIGGLPREVSEAYSEGRRSMSVGCFTGAELLCRKILMYIAVDKGAREGESFASYLTHLETSGYITPPMKAWVDLIRQHGNLATHVLDKPDQKRAESTVMFTAELLRIVYEMDYLAKQYGMGHSE